MSSLDTSGKPLCSQKDMEISILKKSGKCFQNQLQKSLIKASFSAGIKPIVTPQSSASVLSFMNYRISKDAEGSSPDELTSSAFDSRK